MWFFQTMWFLQRVRRYLAFLYSSKKSIHEWIGFFCQKPENLIFGSFGPLEPMGLSSNITLSLFLGHDWLHVKNQKRTDKRILRYCIANGRTDWRMDELTQIQRTLPLAQLSYNNDDNNNTSHKYNTSHFWSNLFHPNHKKSHFSWLVKMRKHPLLVGVYAITIKTITDF